MSEKFKVEPTELAGAGSYVLELAKHADSATKMSVKCAAPQGKDFTGLMSVLEGAVNSLAEATKARQAPLIDDLSGTGNEMKQGAWDYHAQDRKNATSLAHTVIDGGKIVSVDSMSGEVSYGAPTPIQIDEPEHRQADSRSLIDASMGWVGEVDGKIRSLINWSPIEAALEPIAGNWAALETIGEAYAKAGTALGTVGNDLSSVHSRLDPHWDGKAAVAFGDYVNNLSRGLEWEAATGRLIQQGLNLASRKIQDAVKRVLDLLMRSLERFVDFHDLSGAVHTVLKLIPGLGTEKTIDQVTRIIYDIYKTVDTMLTDIKKAIDTVEEFLQFVSDPMGYAGGKIDDKLAPYKKIIDDAEQRAQNTQDLATTADVNRARDAPKQRYEAGAGEAPWEDAP
ncbi:hypothetical protein [Williamsia phyllosphaerae]|uniref:hypothetical protein n=1 Tax=Williamsia phyllosphaerae TaxID=885042 RepID=UPI001665532F|nr:hypothetical protein [Williamsia phyllosphaerae]